MVSDLEQITTLSDIEVVYMAKQRAATVSNDAICDAVKRGIVTQTQIGKRLGISQSAVSQIVAKEGSRKNHDSGTEYTNDIRNQAALRNDNTSEGVNKICRPIETSAPASGLRDFFMAEHALLESILTHSHPVSHPTVSVSALTRRNRIGVESNIRVDERMANLIVALNRVGLTTQFSCQGHPELFSGSLYISRQYAAAHIVFDDLNDAVVFIQGSSKLLLTDSNSMELTTRPDRQSRDRLRAFVFFDPALLDPLTEIWVAK